MPTLTLFTRKSEVDQPVEVVELTEDEGYEWAPEGLWNFAIAASGGFDTEAGKLREGDAFRIENSQPLRGETVTSLTALSANAKLILISLA